MRPDELERLLWEHTEGTISADNRARLDAHLAANPTAEKQRRDVKVIAELLGSVRDIEPPPFLQSRIESAVAARPRPRGRFSWDGTVREMLAPKWRVRIAWAVAGLVVGVTATALMVADLGRTSREDISRFYGAMALPERTVAAALEIELPDALGSFALTPRGRGVVIRLDVTRPVSGGVTVELVAGGLTVESVESSGAAASRVEASGEAIVTALGSAGHVSARIGIPPRAESLTVRVSAAGKQVVERRIEVKTAPRS